MTHLGLDTGFEVAETAVPPTERAWLEIDVRSPDAPYIVKNPWLCRFIKEVLSNPGIRIDHVIIPVRTFVAAAASRAYVQEQATGCPDGERRVAGGLWDVSEASEQERVLRVQFTEVVEELVRYDIPTTMLWYPRLVRDPDYLYEKLAFLLKDHDAVSFRAVFDRVRNLELVHQFTPDDN